MLEATGERYQALVFLFLKQEYIQIRMFSNKSKPKKTHINSQDKTNSYIVYVNMFVFCVFKAWKDGLLSKQEKHGDRAQTGNKAGMTFYVKQLSCDLFLNELIIFLRSVVKLNKI